MKQPDNERRRQRDIVHGFAARHFQRDDLASRILHGDRRDWSCLAKMVQADAESVFVVAAISLGACAAPTGDTGSQPESVGRTAQAISSEVLDVEFTDCLDIAGITPIAVAAARTFVPPQFTLAGNGTSAAFVIRGVVQPHGSVVFTSRRAARGFLTMRSAPGRRAADMRCSSRRRPHGWARTGCRKWRRRACLARRLELVCEAPTSPCGRCWWPPRGPLTIRVLRARPAVSAAAEHKAPCRSVHATTCAPGHHRLVLHFRRQAPLDLRQTRGRRRAPQRAAQHHPQPERRRAVPNVHPGPISP